MPLWPLAVVRDAQSSAPKQPLLPRENRLRSSREIREVVSAGKRVGNSSATLHFLPSETSQFAIIVSKAVGSAVERNLVKRRIRSILASLEAGPLNIKAAVRVKPGVAAASYQTLAADITDLIERAV
ncbi:MAG: ribonuclease P protein component [Aquiluna sp.]